MITRGSSRSGPKKFQPRRGSKRRGSKRRGLSRLVPRAGAGKGTQGRLRRGPQGSRSQEQPRAKPNFDSLITHYRKSNPKLARALEMFNKVCDKAKKSPPKTPAELELARSNIATLAAEVERLLRIYSEQTLSEAEARTSQIIKETNMFLAKNAGWLDRKSTRVTPPEKKESKR